MRPRTLLLLASIVFAACAVLFGRALLLRPESVGPSDLPPVPVDADRAAARLAGMLAIPTVSRDDAPPDTAAFQALHAYLEEAWPRVHATLAPESVGALSRLFTWTGTDSSAAPLILAAHLDVVPPDPADAWTHPPFAGVVADGIVYGRGSTDDKGSVAAILEAVDALIASGFRPARTVYLAFGHDEEIGGDAGAGRMASLLHARGVRSAVVVDEGGLVTLDGMPGLRRPVAVVGIAEKGGVDVRLAARGAGGHSSVPARPMAVEALATALTRLAAEPMPSRLEGPTAAMFRAAAPHMSLPYRVLFANTWLFGPLVLRAMAGDPATDATVRTTTAFTVARAGEKVNVLPETAEATVNFRTLPGDAPENVLAHVRGQLEGLPVRAELLPGAREATRPSAASGSVMDALAASIRGAFAELDPVVVPYLVVGGTDARHYEPVAAQIYRFLPLEASPSEGLPFHAPDEKLTVGQHHRAAQFYATLIRELDRR